MLCVYCEGFWVLLGPLLFFWPFYGFHTRHCLVCSVEANKLSFTLLIRFDLAFWVCYLFFIYLILTTNSDLGENSEKSIILANFLGLEF